MSQTFRVIGRDVYCEIYDGGAVDGTPSYGSAVSINGRARELRISEEIGEIDVAALGDLTKRLRPDQAEWTIEADMVIESTGIVSITLGNYVKLITKAYSSFGAATYEGFLKSQDIVSRMGETAVQRITLRGPADMTVA